MIDFWISTFGEPSLRTLLVLLAILVILGLPQVLSFAAHQKKGQPPPDDDDDPPAPGGFVLPA